MPNTAWHKFYTLRGTGGTWWGSWFNDEIYYGKITINSGQFVSAGVTFNMASLNYVIPANVTYDNCFTLVLYWGVNVTTMNVTYEYQKNMGSTRVKKNIVWN